MPESHGDQSHAEAGAAHAQHEPFNIGAAMLHHNLPYPAWEPVHGKPLLVFDLGTWSAMHLGHLKHDPAFKDADGAKHAEWAKQVEQTADFRYATTLAEQRQVLKGQLTTTLGREPNADELAQALRGDVAKAMAVAEHHAGMVLPRALSFLNQQLFFGGVALLLLFLVIGVFFRRRPEQVKPAGRIQHALEAIVLYIRDEIVKPNLGNHGHGHDDHGHGHAHAKARSPVEVWTPFFVSIFLMILAVNLFGLIPGTGTLSGNIGVTAAFASITLLCMLFFGMKEQGPKFWVSLVPIPFSVAMSPIWFLLLLIELLGLVIKPFALAVRLFANMFAGHTVLLVFLSLGYVVAAQAGASQGLALGLGATGFLLAIAFHAMEILVAFIQAYVFTMLSAMFIGASIHPEH